MFERDLSGVKYILNFQYVAVLIIGIMIVYMFIEKLLSLKRSRLFFVVMILSLISTVFDIFRAFFFNKGTGEVINKDFINVANILSTTYIIFLYMALFVFFVYITYITSGVSHFKNRKALILYNIPIIAVLGLLFANYFTTSLYHYDYADKVIMRMNIPSIIIVISVTALYFTESIYLVIKYRSVFERKQVYALSSTLPIIGVGIVAEMVAVRILVLAFLASICFVLLLTIFETSEDVMDSNTKLYNIDEFVRTVKKVFIAKGKQKCVLVRINNYSELVRTYDLSEVHNYSLDVANEVKRIRREQKIQFDMYSLENGYYATVFNSDDIGELGDHLIEGLKSDKYCLDFIPDYSGCLISFTKDFESFDEAVNFVNNFRETIKFEDDFTIYAKVKNDKNLIVANHLEEIIETGLRENEFTVSYQPIYSIDSNKFKTAEALVRLNSKKYGMIPPAAFISYAENTGRIEEIDSFVMEEVFKFVSSETFIALGLEYIEINLSMAECINPHLIERVRILMEKYNVDPKRVNLEITESFDSSEQELISQNLRKLNEMGFDFSLDDYGTGYSNINRFSTLPISIVKIDKSLVDECDDKDIRKILDYSFSIVKDLNKKTVVEGVETKEQLERFKGYGANYIQGYYFSKPLDYKSYVDFVREKNRIQQ